MQNINKRNISLDIARVIAVMTVVMIHVSALFVIKFETNTLEFLCGNIFDAVSRIGVPIFLMISGSLMLDENKTM